MFKKLAKKWLCPLRIHRIKSFRVLAPRGDGFLECGHLKNIEYTITCEWCGNQRVGVSEDGYYRQ